MLGLPALYAINTFGPGVAGNILRGSFLTTAARDDSLLYERATEHLAGDVLLGSRAVQVERSGSGVRVLVTGPDGAQVIEAKKLLVTIRP